MKKHLTLFIFAVLFALPLISQTAKKHRKQGDSFFKDKNYAGAIEEYTKSNALEVNDYDVLYNRGLCYEYIKDYEKAITDFKTCNTIKNKEKDVYLKLAMLYSTIKDYNNSVDILGKLLLIDEENIIALQKMAWAYIQLQQYEKAVAKMDFAIEKESSSDKKTAEVSHYYRGIAKDSLHDYPAAAFSYKKAITTFKNQAKSKISYQSYFTNLGSVLFKIKQYDESIENLDAAISIDPEDTLEPKNYMAYYLRSLPRFAKGENTLAFDDLNKAAALESKDPIIFYQRGLVLKKTYQYNSAISDFTKCLLLNEKIALAHLYKAQCLMELGNFKETIKECKKYLSFYPSDDIAKALLKDAEEKNYIANRESDAPVIKWYYPFVDQNNFINVYNNQVNVVLEGEVGDKSLIKSISVNGKEYSFNAEELNPQFRFKIPTDHLKKIELVVTDIYNNSATKTVKVGKIVSDTRLIVNMEGTILSDDGSMPLANKNIYITNQKGEQFFATTTDSKGHFIFKNLPFDKDYLIEIEGLENDLTLQNKNFILADKNGKTVLKSNSTGKHKFNFELLQTDLTALSLMEIDEVALTINISGKLFGLMPAQTPLPNINIQLIRSNGEVLIKKTDATGYFSFPGVSPSESFSFKIDEIEAKNINSTTIVITTISGQIIKTIHRNELGFFEYKLLETEKSQMSAIDEPDPWLKITTLSKDKTQLEIIENIYYESGKATLSKDAEKILMKAVEALKSNPKLTLEIESHTDAVDSDDFNLYLSQKRAATVIEFMTGKGIEAKRLTPKGMGETMIINHCTNGTDCSDGEHKQNRRTVFKLTYK